MLAGESAGIVTKFGSSDMYGSATSGIDKESLNDIGFQY